MFASVFFILQTPGILKASRYGAATLEANPLMVLTTLLLFMNITRHRSLFECLMIVCLLFPCLSRKNRPLFFGLPLSLVLCLACLVSNSCALKDWRRVVGCF